MPSSNEPEVRAVSFLRINERSAKPRRRGVTEIRGPYYTPMGTRYLQDILETMSPYIDSLNLADAVGTQTVTVVVRALSVGVAMGRMAGRELLAALAMGAALGVISGPLVWWRWGDQDIALCVALSVFAACSAATVNGMLVVWLFAAFGRDPAIGTAPLRTVIQDLVSILIYLVIALGVVR